VSDKDLNVPDVDIIAQDIDTIDLGGYGAAQSTYSISGYGTDTITLDPTMWTGSITTPSVTTINSINSGYYTIGAAGTSGQYYTSTGTGGNWNNPPVNINTDGIDMAAGTDIKIDGKSLKEFMNRMEERLAILVPDPAKLEKFEALKKAYEHYKLMEKLCQELPKEE
jgi:hypothetical protein